MVFVPARHLPPPHSARLVLIPRSGTSNVAKARTALRSGRVFNRMIELCMAIEPDPVRCAEWFFEDPICELSGATASEALAAGRTEELVSFLTSIACGARDR